MFCFDHARSRLAVAALLCGVTLLTSTMATSKDLPSPEIHMVDLTSERIASIDAQMHSLVPPDARRIPSEPMPQLLDPADRLAFDLAQHIVRKSDHCNDEAFATKRGDALVAEIRSAAFECVNRLFSSAPGSVRFAAFRARNMVDVARAAKDLAVTYDGTNVTSLRETLAFPSSRVFRCVLQQRRRRLVR